MRVAANAPAARESGCLLPGSCFPRGVVTHSGLQGGMFAGFLIGLAIFALAVTLRAGIPGWLGLVTAMVVYSHSPDHGLRALASGLTTWAVLVALRRAAGP